MERTMSVEDKIRRAEEIYARRQQGIPKRTATVAVNSEKRKDLKLFKKLFIQIVVCLFIYVVIYVIQNNNYIFSKDFLNKVNEILSYDVNFSEVYENIKNGTQNQINKMKENNQFLQNTTNQDQEVQEKMNQEEVNQENSTQNTNAMNNSNIDNNQNEKTSQENANDPAIGGAENSSAEKVLSPEEQQIEKIKNTTTFIKPVVGTISSKYGQREPTTKTVPKNHTGVDIAANMGTKIISATDGEVVLASEEGDYGKHLKIQIGDVSIIYAHCNNLYVKQGDRVKQGQEIAEVGSTGNSTGPHLHFEIRISEKTIDPQKILEL